MIRAIDNSPLCVVTCSREAEAAAKIHAGKVQNLLTDHSNVHTPPPGATNVPGGVLFKLIRRQCEPMGRAQRHR